MFFFLWDIESKEWGNGQSISDGLIIYLYWKKKTNESKNSVVLAFSIGLNSWSRVTDDAFKQLTWIVRAYRGHLLWPLRPKSDILCNYAQPKKICCDDFARYKKWMFQPLRLIAVEISDLCFDRLGSKLGMFWPCRLKVDIILPTRPKLNMLS